MIEEKVIAIIAEHFDVDAKELSLSTDLKEDVHADSLDLVELIMAFEDGFGITVSDDAALSIRKIEDIVNYIREAKK